MSELLIPEFGDSEKITLVNSGVIPCAMLMNRTDNKSILDLQSWKRNLRVSSQN